MHSVAAVCPQARPPVDSPREIESGRAYSVYSVYVNEPSEFGRMVLPWIVLPSHAVVCVGITPSGAEHSRTLTPFVLSGAAKAELAGMTTLMLWPLENGMPAVNGLCGWAAFDTMEPLVGPVAPAPPL